MGFIKNNIVLVSSVLVVLVVGGIMLFVDSGITSSIDAAVQTRVDLANQLQGVISGEKVNDTIIKVTRDQVKQKEQASQKVLDQTLGWNHRNYNILTLNILQADGKVRQEPAFPYDQQRYQNEGLFMRFNQAFVEQSLALLPPLHPTAPPSEGELESEAIQYARKLQAKKDAEEKLHPANTNAPNAPGKAPTKTAAPARRSSMDDDFLGGRPVNPLEGILPPGGRRPGATPARPTRNVQSRTSASAMNGFAADVQAEANEKATKSMQVKKARQGWIYIDKDGLNLTPPVPDNSTDVTAAWMAQLRHWAMLDVLNAIKATNDEVLKNVPEESRNVTTSAVKRLMSFEISDYYTGGTCKFGTGSVNILETAATVAPRANSGGGADGMLARPTGGGSFADDMFARPPGGGMMGGFGPPKSMQKKVKSGGANTSSDQAQVLTQRISNAKYDVVHYNFVVVMPVRYLRELEQNLLKQNFHTILRIEMGPVQEQAASGNTRNSASSLYYYGAEPVMEVNLTGELLLFTSWERGTFDSKANNWSMPPLMPSEVLEAQLSEALRPEDTKRVGGGGAGGRSSPSDE